jgi:ribosomal protein S6
MQYELFYLVGASKDASLEKIRTDIKNIVLEEGGVFAEKEVIEKRKLSYAVKHETHGIYVAQRFELEDKEKVQAINKKINLYPDVLRVLLSRADELPELRTKEERMREASAETPEIRPAKKEEVKKETFVAPKPQQEEVSAEKADSQDIDKKLEEILNI